MRSEGLPALETHVGLELGGAPAQDDDMDAYCQPDLPRNEVTLLRCAGPTCF